MNPIDAAAARAARAALVEIFATEVSVAVWGVDVGAGLEGEWGELDALEPAERAAVERAVDKRRIEFARGRACARAALAAAGSEPGAIPAGPNREPLFPEGFVGSLTHCDGFVAAVVARGAEGGGSASGPSLRGVGVDAERLTRLEAGVLDMIVTDFDGDGRGAADWDRPANGCLLFSAKEAVFKAVFPLAGVWIGFEDVGLTVRDRSFEVSWTSDTIDVPELARVKGRWAAVGDLVLTGCWLAA